MAVRERLVLAVLAVSLSIFGACGDDDDERSPAGATPSADQIAEELLDDVEGLADALAAGNYERVYDDFLTAACRELVGRDTYIQNLQESQAQLEATTVQVDDVVVLSQDGSQRVEARVDFTLLADGRPVPRDPEAPPNIETFVLEDGHWRSLECLGFTLTPTPEP